MSLHKVVKHKKCKSVTWQTAHGHIVADAFHQLNGDLESITFAVRPVHKQVALMSSSKRETSLLRYGYEQFAISLYLLCYTIYRKEFSRIFNFQFSRFQFSRVYSEAALLMVNKNKGSKIYFYWDFGLFPDTILKMYNGFNGNH